MREATHTEPLHVSARFRSAVENAVCRLERHAAWDEQRLSLLTDPDHRRRQRWLVDEQLLKAFRLHEMLERMQVREEALPRERRAGQIR